MPPPEVPPTEDALAASSVPVPPAGLSVTDDSDWKSRMTGTNRSAVKKPGSSIMPSRSSMAARYSYSGVMNKTDCLVDIQSIREKIRASAKDAIPAALAKALPQSNELLKAIAENQLARKALGIDDVKRNEILRSVSNPAGGRKSKKSRKSRKSRKMKKSLKPKRGKKSNKRKRTRRH